MPKPFCEHGRLWTTCEPCKKEYEDKADLAALSEGMFKGDRNLAFKCNWIDTDYETPCTAVGRKFNIYDAKHVWCNQPENRCKQFEEGKISEVGEYPCYESGIFHLWKFGAGVYHTGERAGKGKKINKKMVGKMALMTTRGPNESEKDRTIFGFIRIKGYYSDSESQATHVVGDKETSLKIPKDSRLHFWDFYRNPNTPEKIWASGLFRYVNDNSIAKYLNVQLEVLQTKGHKEEADRVSKILEFYKR